MSRWTGLAGRRAGGRASRRPGVRSLAALTAAGALVLAGCGVPGSTAAGPAAAGSSAGRGGAAASTAGRPAAARAAVAALGGAGAVAAGAPLAAPAAGACLSSYPPLNPLPAPGALPAGSYEAKIRDRGRLIAGVSADSRLFGARNSFTGSIEGFDIDMLHAVSQAIFGDPDRIEFRVISAADRITALQNGTVDIVARQMTVTCDRWKSIAFSAVYYVAGQKVLVPRDSKAKGIADLAGQRVCAPAGSTSLDSLKNYPKIRAVSATFHTDCLALFQEGTVDAITGDDTVLAGLTDQDPYARVVGQPLTQEPYGLGIASQHRDFVAFVNAVLAQVRTNGSWQASYNHWLRTALGAAPAPPVPDYGRAG